MKTAMTTLTVLALATVPQLAHANEEAAADTPAADTPTADAPKAVAPTASTPTTEPAPAEVVNKRMAVSGDLMIDVPLGDFADVAGIGIGASGLFRYEIKPGLAVTGRLGYIRHLEKNGGNMGQLLLMGGVRYAAFGAHKPTFVFGELGLNSVSTSITIAGMSFSESETQLAMSGGIGHSFGKMTVAGRLMISALGHIDESIGVLATGGYEFTAF